jgi:hypothetical protein
MFNKNYMTTDGTVWQGRTDMKNNYDALDGINV